MKRVVIIGGGFAGAYVARSLEKSFDVVLIDSKDYFEFTPSILRTIIHPEHARKIQTLHNDYLKKAQFIMGRATKITKNEVFVGNDKINYDYLVIATGSSYNEIFKEADTVLPNRAKELIEKHEALQSANEVLIIGGGVVGVEMAGEIATAYPQKKITLVHSKSRLLERNTPKISKYADSFLKKHGVNIIYNERVTSKKGKIFSTDKRTKINADLSFMCTGITANTELLKKNFPKDVNKDGQALVTPYLQLEEHPNIFVAGDVTAIPEEKLAHNAEHHAIVAIENIKRMESKKMLKPYISKNRIMVISLGKWNGMFVFNNFELTGWIPAIMKWIVELKTMAHYKAKAMANNTVNLFFP